MNPHQEGWSDDDYLLISVARLMMIASPGLIKFDVHCTSSCGLWHFGIFTNCNSAAMCDRFTANSSCMQCFIRIYMQAKFNDMHETYYGPQVRTLTI